MKYFFVFIFLGINILFSHIRADNFLYNTFNNHGSIGLVNMPTARFYDESSYGITIYDGSPDQKITMTSYPFDWLEASFFYNNIQDKPYCAAGYDPVCNQDYKDKGFNFKVRLKEEGVLPAIAIGINDIAGTGFYSSEYIVGSYGVNKTDFHFGLGWGLLNGPSKNFKNPLHNTINLYLLVLVRANHSFTPRYIRQCKTIRNGTVICVLVLTIKRTMSSKNHGQIALI